MTAPSEALTKALTTEFGALAARDREARFASKL